MKNLLLLFGIISIILASSCTKENEPTTNPPQDDYTPMAIGNYWIYQYYKIDTLGNEEEISIIDSIYIDKDTLINNNQYFVFAGESFSTEPRYMRDSLDYLVSEKGTRLFSSSNFTDILYEYAFVQPDTLYTIGYKMEQEPNSVTVPSGTYENALNYKGTLITYNPNPGVHNPRIQNTYYVKNIGKILSAYYYLSSPTRYERRLVRYHIE